MRLDAHILNIAYFLRDVYSISVTVICIPVAVGQALYRIWLYGEFMCKLTGFLQGKVMFIQSSEKAIKLSLAKQRIYV